MCKRYVQPCQNVPAAGNFAAFSQFLAAFSTLDFTRSPLAGKGAWSLLPTTPGMLPTATKHFDRAVCWTLPVGLKPYKIDLDLDKWTRSIAKLINKNLYPKLYK